MDDATQAILIDALRWAQLALVDYRAAVQKGYVAVAIEKINAANAAMEKQG